MPTGCIALRQRANYLAEVAGGSTDGAVVARPAAAANAARQACDDLRLSVLSIGQVGVIPASARILARNSADERFTIDVVPTTASTARLTVSTRMFDDPWIRQRIIDTIRARIEASNAHDVDE